MPKTEIIKRSIEQVSSDIKKSAWGSVFESLAIIVLGVLFIVWPETMVKIVTYVVGAIFIVRGAFQVINYFIEQGHKDFFNNGLLAGVISILIGIAALAIGDEIANVFRIVVGIWLIYESLVRINTAIKLSSVGIPIWKYILILAIVIMLLGIFVTFNDVTTVIGWMMIVAGLVCILGDIMYIQKIDLLVSSINGQKDAKL